MHPQAEKHYVARTGWLRAAVLGANDGIISTASLMVGVAASGINKHAIILTGLAGLVAGALSMAAGEYVSVSSQADSESADLTRERRELKDAPEDELKELADLYEKRGLTKALAHEVAVQLSAKDALAAHARDELGFSEHSLANPLQAALASAFCFGVGAIMPLMVVIFCEAQLIVPLVTISSLLGLAALGALGARAGGSGLIKAVVRVTFWGALALLVTAGVGRLFGAVI
jgi:vacuolar iron transporter family protein